MTRLLNASDVAALLRKTTKAVYQMVYRGELPYIKLGNGAKSPIRFREEDIDKFLSRCPSVDVYVAKE